MRTDPEIAPEPFDAEAAQALTVAHRVELHARYGNDGSGGEPRPDEFEHGGVFLVARLRGRPVGCGGLRRLDRSTAEIKRMFVVPDARGLGIGRSILRALEDAAQVAGYARIRLETGRLQPEALALYESAGYRRTPAYRPFAHDPDSVCFERELAL
jgi:GNAT superfamily N-acetyltransferase